MATKTMSGFFGDAFRRKPQEEPLHPVIHERRVAALVLTALTLALGIVLFAVLGPDVLALYLPMLPVGFVLLWISTEALRFDERERGEVSPMSVQDPFVTPPDVARHGVP
jgi:hypothetical protein